MNESDPIVAASSLTTPSVTRICVDARPGEGGAASYAQAHVEGAVHLDLERDLSARVRDPASGGRHPLPPVDAFCARLGAVGITPDSEVVVYDEQGGANAAARLWWMLRAIGHRRVWVLDGGLGAAIAAGIPLSDTSDPVQPSPPYPAQDYSYMRRAEAAAVEQARLDTTRCVIDVRAAPRYRGDSEPIDPIAGHIPGAINVPLTVNLDANGRFLPAAALRANYTAVLQGCSPAATIVHCGSGVTACHTLLALQRAGLGGAALYVGSWSEWCRHPEWPREP